MAYKSVLSDVGEDLKRVNRMLQELGETAEEARHSGEASQAGAGAALEESGRVLEELREQGYLDKPPEGAAPGSVDPKEAFYRAGTRACEIMRGYVGDSRDIAYRGNSAVRGIPGEPDDDF